MLLGWWVLIPTVIVAVGSIFLDRGSKKWPGPVGWAMVALGIGIFVADGFKSWATVSMGLIFFGAVLGFAGVLNSPNSPAK